eukprot:NODE_5165_length_1057_cov_30.536403_g4608_i0.p1 GENE.NODE_5165_length_1057_cov_30.536403_g4608_i0~~NODE_5165_length_1057_cov_30.536403_g4608_i0.p1  ORF type:complete len:316 (+),score=37.21 NODE_5165_length_1057_cov_30.536403_g4608_i0:119-949(+)
MVQQMVIHRTIQILRDGDAINLMSYFNTLISILILSYFSILIQLIKLFLCIPYGRGQYVNYFYPSVQCWSYYHIFAVVFNSGFVAVMTTIFSIITYVGFHLPNDHKLLPTLLKCQIPVASTISKWWTFIFLFFRIIYLSMFVMFTSFQNNKDDGIVGMNCVSLVMALVLAWFKPFPIYHDNILAVMLTFGLGISLSLGLVHLAAVQYFGILTLAIFFIPTIVFTIYRLTQSLSKIKYNIERSRIRAIDDEMSPKLNPSRQTILISHAHLEVDPTTH